jgi:8-oxo-dGTP pyrophosphatase MutT (NUDIX family)
MQVVTRETNSGTMSHGDLTAESVTELDSLITGIYAPSPASTDKPVEPPVEVDYKSVDYRGFIFVVHKIHGLMLLHCTRKKSKGPHFQLPGGHVDEFEFLVAAHSSRDAQTQLLTASRAGAARELFEETGMDMRNHLDRLEPASLRSDVTLDKKGKPLLKNELKHRLYFVLSVTDEDFWSTERGDSAAGRVHPLCADGKHLMLKVSIEHSGWTFEKDPNKSAEMLAVHSGGTGAAALRMSMARGGVAGMEQGQSKDKQQQGGDPQESHLQEPEKKLVTEIRAAAGAPPPVDLLPPPEPNVWAKLFSKCC